MPRINYVMTDGSGGSTRLAAGQLAAEAAPYGYVEVGSDELDAAGSFPFRIDEAGNVTAGSFAAGTPGAAVPLGLSRVATTGVNGFALQNATPTILSWTAPDDGQLHEVLIFAALHVTSAETGGVIYIDGTYPDGTPKSFQLLGGGQATGFLEQISQSYLCAPGTPVQITQNSALTAGAATLWATIRAS